MFLKKIIIIMILFIFIASNILCEEKVTSENEVEYFTKENFRMNKMIVSPINDKLIWMIDFNGDSYELNPETGKWTKLTEIFGDFVQGVSRIIVQDKYFPELLWLGNHYKGVLVYDKINKSSEIFLIEELFNKKQALTLIKPAKQIIWIGTSNGLYRLFRDSKKMEKVDEVSGFWVNHITLIKDGNLLINGKYEYNPKNRKIKSNIDIFGYEFTQIVELSEKENIIFFYDNMTSKNKKSGNRRASRYKTIFIDVSRNVHIFPFKLRFWNMILEKNVIWFKSNKSKGYDSGLIKYSTETRKAEKIELEKQPGRIYNDQDFIWSIDKLGLSRINKNNYEIYKTIFDSSFELAPTDNFIAQKKSLWFGLRNGAVRISKTYLNSLLLPYDQIKDKEETLISLEKKLKREKDIFKYLQGYFEFINLTNSKNKIDYINKRLKNILILREKNKIEEFENLLKTETNRKIKEAIYYSLYTGYALNCDPAKALEKYQNLKQYNPQSIFITFFNEKDLNKLELAKPKLDSLKITGLSEPEKLFEKGKIFYEMLKLSWNIGDGFYGLYKAFDFNREIIKKFPESELADNAEYEILLHNEMCSHEGGDNEANLNYIEKYEELLKKYPDSELIPDILFRICSLYFWYTYSYEDLHSYYDERKYLLSAKMTAENIIVEYPEFQDIESVHQQLDRINKFIDEIFWEFEIKSNKVNYIKNEKIEITFELINIMKKVRNIKIFEDNSLPNFSVFVYYYRDKIDKQNAVFIKFSKNINTPIQNKNKIEKTMQPDEIYSEKWEITNQLTDSKFRGEFDFSSEGFYKITGIFKVGGYYRIQSENIWITVSDEN